ncbi:hypothetical protein C1645_827777 [Glomus cerebriforme]|uniref:Uncharacterized protein n=1 Tax=Glomus cerebriforme TaxID=658196 RepID=A0A397SRA9_9GLOM|nr:hypothetical protein C1645_827777 [Glomus cerebriforme]
MGFGQFWTSFGQSKTHRNFGQFWTVQNCPIEKSNWTSPKPTTELEDQRLSGKGFTVDNHPFEVYGIPDAHECIDGNLPLRLVLDIDVRQKPDPMNPELPFLDKYKITREDLLSRILIACVNILYSDLNHLAILDAFALASSSNTNKCSWHIVYKYAQFVDYRDLRGFVKKVADRVGKPYFEFIDLGLYKSRFNLWLLGSAKEDRVKRPAVFSVKQGYRKLEDYLVQPKSDYSKI